MIETASTIQIAEANRRAHLERSKVLLSLLYHLRKAFRIPLGRVPALTGLSR